MPIPNRRLGDKDPVTRAEFLALRDEHEALVGTVTTIHTELMANTNVTKEMKGDLETNTASTTRTESKIDTLVTSTSAVVTAFTNAQGAFNTLEWLGKLGFRLGWIAVVSGTSWAWLTGKLGPLFKWLQSFKTGS